jgi:uncharacterized membrane protein YqgA involved in biofilm formation
MPFLGTIINAAVIVVFSLLGSLLKRGISERISQALFSAISVAVVFLGIDGAMGEAPAVPQGFFLNAELTKFAVIILSLVIGTAIGELIDIQKHVERIGNILENKLCVFNPKAENKGNFAKGFIICTLTTCVGSMAVQGAILDGVGQPDILIAKSVLDAISCFVFSSTLGIGCAFSAIPMVLYQGGITLLSFVLSDVIPTAALSYLSATGSLILVLIGLNGLGATNVRTANMTPAIFVPLVLAPLINLF